MSPPAMTSLPVKLVITGWGPLPLHPELRRLLKSVSHP
jgi:hypothetical protein